MGIGQQLGHEPIIHRTIRAHGAEFGEIHDGTRHHLAKREAAKGIGTARTDAAAVAGRAAQVGQGPMVDDDGRKTRGDDGAAAANIADAGGAQEVDLRIGRSGNDG